MRSSQSERPHSLLLNDAFALQFLQRFTCHQGFDAGPDWTGLLVQVPGDASVAPIMGHLQVLYVQDDCLYMSRVTSMVEGADGIVIRLVLKGFHRVKPHDVPTSCRRAGVYLNIMTAWHALPSTRSTFTPPAHLPTQQVAS